MGNFYTNFTLRSPTQQAAAALLAGRSTVVTPERDGCLVVFDEESDEQNEAVIKEFGSWLSYELFCPVLAVLNHDDDIFWYQLHVRGELIDEYNSTPGYFNTTDEAASMAGPTGGDAEKLCGAFGQNDVGAVRRILKRPDYVFAFERHAELADALGIPSFGVGVGFSYLSSGEMPEGLVKNELVWTKSLATGQPVSQKLEDVKGPAPGYYKANTRLIARTDRLARSIPIGWMPGLWSEVECTEQDLSDGFRRATGVARAQFRQLGFVELGFKRLGRILNPNSRDRGAINYLDSSRAHFGQLHYHRERVQKANAEKVSLLISFTAVFQDGVLACTNNMNPPPGGGFPDHEVIRLDSKDVAHIYETFCRHLGQRAEKPRSFLDLDSLKAWYDENQTRHFENCVRRGLYVRMSEEEVEFAKSKLPLA